MAWSIGPQKTFHQLFSETDKQHKAAYLRDLGFWEVEIGEMLAEDDSPFDETWCRKMAAKRGFDDLKKLIQSHQPKPILPPKPGKVPWAALGCSGLTGILGTYSAEKHPVAAFTAGVVALIGLALFVKWVHAVWKHS